MLRTRSCATVTVTLNAGSEPVQIAPEGETAFANRCEGGVLLPDGVLIEKR